MAYKKIQGTSLLEVMISILLSAIILAEIFRYSYYLESTLKFSAEKVASIEENNVLFAWLVRDIEMAGYMGCVNVHSRSSIIDDHHYLSSTWLTANGGVLESQYMSPQQFLIIEKSSDNEVLIAGRNGLSEDNVVIIQNCWEAETAKIKKIHRINYDEKNRLEFYSPLKMQHFDNAYVAKLIRHNYFIQNHISLYVINEKNDSDEVLENISNMNILPSQNDFTISIRTTQSSEPILLSARAYNAS
jgi:hypothetical protein